MSLCPLSEEHGKKLLPGLRIWENVGKSQLFPSAVFAL